MNAWNDSRALLAALVAALPLEEAQVPDSPFVQAATAASEAA